MRGRLTPNSGLKDNSWPGWSRVITVLGKQQLPTFLFVELPPAQARHTLQDAGSGSGALWGPLGLMPSLDRSADHWFQSLAHKQHKYATQSWYQVHETKYFQLLSENSATIAQPFGKRFADV